MMPDRRCPARPIWVCSGRPWSLASMAAFLLPGKRSVRAFGIGWGSQKAKAGFLRGEDFFRFSLYGLQREDNVGNGVK